MDKGDLAYIIGVSLGDGNLSNPNGRATRLRVSCDTTYPNIIKRICGALERLFPNNKVTIVHNKKLSCIDISCYSNQLETLLGWRAKGGSKFQQQVSVPAWIKRSKKYAKACLRGLLETDGSLYNDRGYLMVNFTSTIAPLAQDVIDIIHFLGFRPHCYKIETKHKAKYVIRVSKGVKEFVEAIGFIKD